MFTGIIESLGKIAKIDALKSGLRFKVASDLKSLTIGDSIAVNGVCFTVTDLMPSFFCFDASPETLNKTTFNLICEGDEVHLEIPLSLSKPLGGHFVTGHVDETLVIQSIEKLNDFSRYVLSGINHPQWICSKGSITLDGVSLTINKILSDERIECMLIPHTISSTRFKNLKENELVNAEYDYLAKIVARQYCVSKNEPTLSSCEEI